MFKTPKHFGRGYKLRLARRIQGRVDRRHPVRATHPDTGLLWLRVNERVQPLRLTVQAVEPQTVDYQARKATKR